MANHISSVAVAVTGFKGTFKGVLWQLAYIRFCIQKQKFEVSFVFPQNDLYQYFHSSSTVPTCQLEAIYKITNEKLQLVFLKLVFINVFNGHRRCVKAILIGTFDLLFKVTNIGVF